MPNVCTYVYQQSNYNCLTNLNHRYVRVITTLSMLLLSRFKSGAWCEDLLTFRTVFTSLIEVPLMCDIKEPDNMYRNYSSCLLECVKNFRISRNKQDKWIQTVTISLSHFRYGEQLVSIQQSQLPRNPDWRSLTVQCHGETVYLICFDTAEALYVLGVMPG